MIGLAQRIIESRGDHGARVHGLLEQEEPLDRDVVLEARGAPPGHDA